METGFYWQMANSKAGHHMFLMGLAYPGLAKIKKECVEHAMASVVELSLASTFSHSWIQLGFISLGHFGWFFWEEPHQSHIGEEFSKNVVWLCSTICFHGLAREESGGESTCMPRPEAPDQGGAHWHWGPWHVFEMKGTTEASETVHFDFHHSTFRKPLYFPPGAWSPHNLLSKEDDVFYFTRSFKSPKLLLKQTSVRSARPF